MSSRPAGNGFFARLQVLDPAPPWSMTSALVTVFAGFIAFTTGGIVALTWIGDQPIAAIIGWCLGALATILIVLQTRRQPAHREALKLGASRTPLLFIIFLGVGLAVTIDLISAAVTGAFLIAPELLNVNFATGGAGPWLFAVIFMIGLQPIAEELVFRGMLFPRIRQAAGAWGGLLLSALMYALFHLLIYPPAYGDASQFAALWYTFVVPLLHGLVIGAARARTQSTRAAIGMHAAFGLFAVIKLATLLG